MLSIWLIVSTSQEIYSQFVNDKFEEVRVPVELEGFYGQSVVRDSDGFIWIGSNLGLHRYDGTTFKSYTVNEATIENTNQRWDPFIPLTYRSLLEDGDGILWFTADFLLSSFNRKTEKFRFYTDSLLRAPFYNITEGSDGYIWMGSQSGLSRFDRTTGTFKHYLTYDVDHPDAGKNPVYRAYEDREGRLWLIYLSGSLGIFDREKGSFRDIENLPGSVQDIYQDHQYRHWLATTTGLYRLYQDSGTWEQKLGWRDISDRLHKNFFIRIAQDTSGGFWINNVKGIQHYNDHLEETGSWNFLTEPVPSDLDSVVHMPRRPYYDNCGTLWFFADYRIGKIIQQENHFSSYLPDTSIMDCTGSPGPDHMVYMSNTFATNNGIYALNRQSRLIRRVKVNHDDKFKGYCFSLRDMNGNIWVSTEGSGLFRGTPAKDGTISFENVFSDPGDSTNVPGLYIYHLFEDRKGRIWLEVKGQLPCFYDPARDRIMRVVNNPDSRDRLPGENALGYSRGSIQGETISGILLGSNRSTGIYAMVPPFIEVSENVVMPTAVIRFRLQSGEGPVKGWEMYQSPRDTTAIWCRGTTREGGGFHKLTLLQPGTNDFIVKKKVYGIDDGLISPHIYGFREDFNGNFWLGTSGGLYCFDPVKETFLCFTQKDGLPGKSFVSNVIQCNDGELFFCTTSGHFVSFYPDSLRLNSRIPPVFITDIAINQQTVSPGDVHMDTVITYAPHLHLKYNQNNLSISYAALNYVVPDQNQYKYRLEGLQSEWINAGNRTMVEFTNLKPGKYRFRVAGSNNAGIWNKREASLAIEISRPPWNTIWAYLMYGFVMTGIILWYRRFHNNRSNIRTALEVERVEKEKIRELDRMKSRFFTNVTHEFRTPLTLILGSIEAAKRKGSRNSTWSGEQITMMNRNAKRLQHLINQLLDISKLESGNTKLQIGEGDLTESIKITVHSFISIAERKNIRYSFELQDGHREVFFDQDIIEKILNNLINNAFKFTSSGGQVKVKLQFDPMNNQTGPRFAELTVSDTGKGIPPDQLDRIFDRFYQVTDSDTREHEGTGIGLSLTKDLVSLCHGEIRVESTVGKGTTFVVKLPVSAEQFSVEDFRKGEAISRDMERTDEDETDQDATGMAGTAFERKGEGISQAPVIMIVEDNTDMKAYIYTMLSTRYRIISAENGKLGYQLAVDTIPDLVIGDIMMPVMDGMEMCRMLKDDDRTSHVPVILLTAKADRKSKLSGLATGADDYIVKPFDAEELLARVKNLIDQRNKLKAKFKKEFIAASVAPHAEIQDRFLHKLVSTLEEHLSDPEFTMEELGKELHLSRAQLYRKVDAVAGVSPHELLRMIRMKRSAQLLITKDLNVTQVMYQVGMRNTSHFARSFHHYFGINPSEYRQSNKI